MHPRASPHQNRISTLWHGILLVVEESYPPHQWHSTGSGRRYISCFLVVSISEVIFCVSEIWPNPIQWLSYNIYIYIHVYIVNMYYNCTRKSLLDGLGISQKKTYVFLETSANPRTGWVGWLSCLQHFGPLRGWCPGRRWRWQMTGFRRFAETRSNLLVQDDEKLKEAAETKPPKERGRFIFLGYRVSIYIYIFSFKHIYT